MMHNACDAQNACFKPEIENRSLKDYSSCPSESVLSVFGSKLAADDDVLLAKLLSQALLGIDQG